MEDSEMTLENAIYSMHLGQRIVDNGKPLYGFDWVITRVPGGWLYTAETALSPCTTFVPYSDEFLIKF